MHTDFAPVLQVLFHAALDAFRSPDGVNISAESLLEECQQSIKDLATMLFKYYGKVIVQPHHDLFTKASGLRVSQSSDTGFMTRVEADAAMESAKQTELISMHIDRSAPTAKPSFNKKAKARGGGKGGGKGTSKVPLRLLPQQQGGGSGPVLGRCPVCDARHRVGRLALPRARGGCQAWSKIAGLSLGVRKSNPSEARARAKRPRLQS